MTTARGSAITLLTGVAVALCLPQGSAAEAGSETAGTAAMTAHRNPENPMNGILYSEPELEVRHFGKPELSPNMNVGMSDTLRWDSPVPRKVRATLGARWGVLPEAVLLEWSPFRMDWTPTDHAAVKLLGTGGNGYWIVTVEPEREGQETIRVRVRAGVQTQRPVATRSLRRGDVLADEDIDMAVSLVWGDPLSPRDEASTVQAGWVVERVIEEGRPLKRPAVRPAHAVASGRPVEILYDSGSVKLTLVGRALGSAALGERVYVRTTTGQRLEGLAVGDGQVEVAGVVLEIVR